MAASSTGSLNARLTLTGSDDVKRQLEDVANAGERSLGKLGEAGGEGGFEGLEGAAEHIKETFESLANLGSLGGIGGLFEGIAGSVGKFNVILGAGLGIITGAAAGFYELAEKGAKFASEIKDGATRVGVAAKDYASLRFAFEQSAASAEDFEKAMGVILEASQLPDEGAANVQKAADKIVKDEDRIKAAAESTADAWRKRADTLSEISIKSGQDLTAINLTFTRAIDAANKLDGDKETEARKKASDDRIEAVRLLNLRIAEEQRLAAKAYQEAQDQIARDNKKAYQKNLDDYKKALDESADKAQGAAKKFQDLGVSLHDAGDKARDPAEVFRDVADKLNDIEDPASKAAKAVDLFGRRIGTKLVEALSEGREALKKLEDEAKDLNLIPNDLELDAGKKFDDQIAKLGSVISAAAGRMGLQFTPIFGPVVDALATSIGHAIPGLIALASSVVEVLRPIFTDITNAILGDTDKIKSQFTFQLVTGVQVFVAAVRGAGTVIGAVLQGLVYGFNLVDGVVQTLFHGVSLGGIAGFILSVTALAGAFNLVYAAVATVATGAFSLLATAIGPIVGGMTAIAAVIGWPALLIAGLVGLIATLLLAGDGWERFKNGVYTAAKAVAQFIVSVSGPFYTFFDGLVSYAQKGWDIIVYGFNYALGTILKGLDYINDKISAVANALSNVFGGGGSTDFHAINVGGSAAGGPINGPGTGTSDSILRWLSNGEYVVKARAVKYWGLNVMHSLNNMVSPKGYAAGGYVDALGGAMTSSARMGSGLYQAAAATEGRVAVDLSHNGTTFYGLLAPARVAAAMDRYASSQQRVSLGRRSSAYGAPA